MTSALASMSFLVSGGIGISVDDWTFPPCTTFPCILKSRSLLFDCGAVKAISETGLNDSLRKDVGSIH